MASTTANLGMTLPAVSDPADIGVLNENFKKIDEKCNPSLFAPSGIVTGDHLANSDDEFSSIVASVYNGMADHTTKFINVRAAGTQFSGYWTVEINRYDASMGSAVAWCFGDTIQAALYRGAWQPFEWHNPGMLLGVEYRTTERHNGKPVYAKLLSVGNLPNASGKNIEGVVTSGFSELVELRYIVKNASGHTQYSYDRDIRMQLGTDGTFAWLGINTTTDLSGFTGTVLLKWTKP